MIAVKPTVVNEVNVFSIKYRYSINLIFIYSVDKTLRVIKIIDFNRTEPTW